MTTRLLYVIGFLVITALLAFGLYLQYFDNMIPCPLCTLQRVTFVCMGVTFLFGAIVASKNWGRIITNTFLILFSLTGIFLAGRQVWLQHFPPANPGECGASLQYMMQVLSFNELVQKIFAGSAECTTRGAWSFLTLSMAEWSFIWFVGLLVGSIYLINRKNK